MVRAAEAERMKRTERVEQRHKDGGLTVVAKSGGKQNMTELKLPLDIKTEPCGSANSEPSKAGYTA